MKKTVFLSLSFLMLARCWSQAPITFGCYIHKSEPYIGDYTRVCLNSDGTFTYVFHMYDVIGDTYSQGYWRQTVNGIEFESIEKEVEIMQTGKPLKDSLYIEFVNAISLEPALYVEVIEFRTSQLITGCMTDANGKAILNLVPRADVLKCAAIGVGTVYVDLKKIKYDHITVKIEPGVYKDLSGFRLMPNQRGYSNFTSNEKGSPVFVFMER